MNLMSFKMNSTNSGDISLLRAVYGSRDGQDGNENPGVMDVTFFEPSVEMFGASPLLAYGISGRRMATIKESNKDNQQVRCCKRHQDSFVLESKVTIKRHRRNNASVSLEDVFKCAMVAALLLEYHTKQVIG